MEMQISKQVGDRIRTYRKLQKITLEELGSRVNKSKSAISKYEKGVISIDMDTLYDIASALNIPSHFLIIPDYSSSPEAEKLSDIPSLLYFYTPKEGSRFEIAPCRLEFFPGLSSDNMIFYANLKSEDLSTASYLYRGNAFISDTTFFFSAYNQQNRLDQVTFLASRPYISKQTYFIGLYTGLAYKNSMPLCGKALVSETPFTDYDKLSELLRATSEEINYLKKNHYFSL